MSNRFNFEVVYLRTKKGPPDSKQVYKFLPKFFFAFKVAICKSAVLSTQIGIRISDYFERKSKSINLDSTNKDRE
jgi:hypothetical protein